MFGGLFEGVGHVVLVVQALLLHLLQQVRALELLALEKGRLGWKTPLYRC